MSGSRGTVVVVALVCAATATGCGLGPGDESDEQASLKVTRDYGVNEVVPAVTERPTESDTVMRFLDRAAEIETRYGGGFVQSIEGLAGTERAGRRYDWFFYVNGVESGKGAAAFTVRGGDEVWWDFRDWTDAMRVPAVVGSYPEPLVHGYDGTRWPVVVSCLDAGEACETATSKLRDAGVKASSGSEKKGAVRILIGPWERVRRDSTASLLEEGPERSGVFARVDREGRWIELLYATGKRALRIGSGSGIVAALRHGDDPPVWVVSGLGEMGLERAVEQLDERDLRDHYAVAIGAGGATQLPLP
jgi:hypothetical protein